MARIRLHVVALFIITLLSVTSAPPLALAQQLSPPCHEDGATVAPEPIGKIHVDRVLEPLVAALLAKSATFRRQWDLINASRFIRVTVASRLVMHEPSTARARTQVSRYEHGSIRATIELPGATNLTELLPHEFEHVIEQLEGLDLPALARQHGAGVVQIDKGVYETARAQAAGLKAYREVYGETDPALTAALGGVRRAWRRMGSESEPENGSNSDESGRKRRPVNPAGPAAHLHKRW